MKHIFKKAFYKRLGVIGTLALIVTGILISLNLFFALTAVEYRQDIKSTATISTIGIEVFWDITCTDLVTHIDWGVLYPSDIATETVFIRNSAGRAITGSMWTSNWIPVIAMDYMELTWDFGDAPLFPMRVRETKFMLSISADVENVTDFSFDITVLGTETIYFGYWEEGGLVP